MTDAKSARHASDLRRSRTYAGPGAGHVMTPPMRRRASASAQQSAADALHEGTGTPANRPTPDRSMGQSDYYTGDKDELSEPFLVVAFRVRLGKGTGHHVIRLGRSDSESVRPLGGRRLQVHRLATH